MIGSDSSAAGGAGFILILLAAGLYLIPTIVAWVRKVPHLGSVMVINVALGWTFIGWVVALAMACRSGQPGVNVTVQTYQGPVPPQGQGTPPPLPPPPPPEG